MLQTLFHIPSEIGGLPVFGFGLLLAVWAVFGAGLLAWLGRRQGLNADTLGYLPLLALVGAIIVWLLPALCDPPHGLPIRGYGVMMLFAVLAATGLTIWRGRARGVSADTVFSIAFWMFVPGIIGARLFYVIEYWPDNYGPEFQRGLAAGVAAVLKVNEGGLVVFGGLVGALLGLLLFVRKQRLPLWATCDLVAPGLALAQALGRIGCLLNGCCFGGPCEHAWAVTFPGGESPSAPYQSQIVRGQFYGLSVEGPANAPPLLAWVDDDSPLAAAGIARGNRLAAVNGAQIETVAQAHTAFRRAFEGHKPVQIEVEGRAPVLLPAVEPPPRSRPVAPAQILSAIDAFVLCLTLLAWSPFCRRDGELFALTLTLHPISRFLLEIIRTDEAPVFQTGLSISQNISLLMLAAAAALWWRVLRSGRRA